jgi:type I restriction enzyme S subunit
MSDLPSAWTATDITGLCKKIRGVSYNKDQASREPKPDYVSLLRANNLNNDALNFDDLVFVPKQRVSDHQILRLGDVVIAMSSGSKSVVGKTAQLHTDWAGTFGAFCGVLRPVELIEPKFFGYFFRTRYYRNTISELAAGSNINNLKNEHFEQIQVPIPPLNEQKRIVAKLEKLLGKVEAAQERLDKIPVILKRFRQSVLAAACSGKLTGDWRNSAPSEELPADWQNATLGQHTELITKGASPKWQGINYAESGVLFVTSENVGVGKMLLDKPKFVEKEFSIRQKRSILQRGDLLTNIVGASIGRSAIYDREDVANINQAVALIRLNKGISRNYVLMVLNSPILVQHMNEEKVDVARANLSLKDVAAFPLPLPPIEEQKEIVRRVEDLFKFADQIEERYKKARTYTDKLTQSILAKAFRGELVPQDPMDEPASALLKRIKEDEAKRAK